MGQVNSHLRVVSGTEACMTKADEVVDFEHVFRRYSPYVASIVLRLLGRRHEVEDLVQDVFLEAHRGLSNLRDSKAIKGWLATITVRVVRKKLRAQRFKSLIGFDEAYDYSELVDDGSGPEQRALINSVYRRLDRLPANQRLAWMLKKIQGEDLKSIADLCGCSLATVKRHIARADHELREVLDDGL